MASWSWRPHRRRLASSSLAGCRRAAASASWRALRGPGSCRRACCHSSARSAGMRRRAVRRRSAVVARAWRSLSIPKASGVIGVDTGGDDVGPVVIELVVQSVRSCSSPAFGLSRISRRRPGPARSAADPPAISSRLARAASARCRSTGELVVRDGGAVLATATAQARPERRDRRAGWRCGRRRRPCWPTTASPEPARLTAAARASRRSAGRPARTRSCSAICSRSCRSTVQGSLRAARVGSGWRASAWATSSAGSRWSARIPPWSIGDQLFGVPGVGGLAGAGLAGVAPVGVQGGAAQQVAGLPGAALGAVDGAGPGVRQVRGAVLAGPLHERWPAAPPPRRRGRHGR